MIVARVRRTLVERRLVASGDHVLAACSGGPDSVAMVHVLGRLARPLGLTLLVASVDHGLREGSADDVEAVGRLADSLGLPFRGLRVEVPPGASIQAAARAARYEALRGLAVEEGATRIAVGHTLDDQAETVLARMLRGSGVPGLAGVAPRRRDGVVRPLIDCRRSEVRAHVAHHGLPVVEDPSNADRRFERVRIRLDLMPALADEDPAIAEHLAGLADDARAIRGLLSSRGRRLVERAEAGGEGLGVAVLLRAGEAVRRAALGAWLARETGRAPGRVHLAAVSRLLRRSGEVLLGDDWSARVVDGRLVLERRAERATRSRRRTPP